MNYSNPSKYLGKKSSPCRKCGSVKHYVNPMGGISCFSCYPPRRPDHVCGVLISESGVWVSESDAFGPVTSPAKPDRSSATDNTSPSQLNAVSQVNVSSLVVPDINWPVGVVYVTWGNASVDSVVVYDIDSPVMSWPPRIDGRRIVTQSIVDQMARWCEIRLKRQSLLDKELSALLFAGWLIGFLGEGVFPAPVCLPGKFRQVVCGGGLNLKGME